MQNTYSPPHITKEKTEIQGMWFSGRVLVHHAQGMGSFLAQTTKPDPHPSTHPPKKTSARGLQAWSLDSQMTCALSQGQKARELLLSSSLAEASRNKAERFLLPSGGICLPQLAFYL